MSISLIKNKGLIYLLIFLFFNFFSFNIKAAETTRITQYDANKGTGEQEVIYIRGVTFNTDGSKMFVTGGAVGQYSLTTNFDISNVTFISSLPDNVAIAAPNDIRFSSNGLKMYLAPLGTNALTEYTLSTAFDPTSQTSTKGFTLTNSSGTSGLAFNSDGTSMFVTDAANKQIDEYTLDAGGFDLSSGATYRRSLDISANTNASAGPKSLIFSTDGKTMFVLDNKNKAVDEYFLTTGFDLTTATFIETTGALANLHDSANSIALDDDGSHMFISQNHQHLIQSYSLGANNNLSTPVISTFSPADNATGIELDANIVLTFDEIVDVESGNIKIFKSDGTEVTSIDVTDSQVTGTGTAQITINPTSDLEENTQYYITIDSGAFNDVRDAAYTGISDATTLNFTTTNSAPTLVSTVPADDTTDVEIDANIVLNFSESVNADDGDIVIYKTSGGSEVETIASTASNVTGSGTSQITINPSADFEYGVEYYVLIDSGAFDDDNDEDYTGITSTTALSFTVNNRVDPTTIKDVVGSIDAQSELAKNYIRQSIDTVSNRLRYLRENKLSNTLSKHDLPIHIDIGDTVLTSLVNDGLSVNDSLSKNTNSIMPDSWSAWSAGSIYVSKIGDSLTSSSQETEGQAFALGFDKKFSDSDFLGFAIQYDQSDTDIGTNGTRIDSENINFSVYQTKPSSDNKFIETFLGFGLIESDLKRVHNSNTLTGSRDGTQIFGSINYGKTFYKGDFNITPVGRLDLGYIVLDDYAETGIDALYYASQRIESGLASFGFEFSDNIQLNENKFQPFGSLTYMNDFSNSSDAKINYVADTSTIYTYTQQANSKHLISSLIGLTYTAGDFLNINSSYKNTQGNSGKTSEAINFAINFTSNRKTQYMLSLAGNENIEAKLGISKNIQGIDLGFNANQTFSDNPNQKAELVLTYSF